MGFVSQALRDSARNRGCSLQLPGICNHDPKTTVLAHLSSPVKGMGNKSDDWHAVFACSACHEALDQKVWAVDWYILRGLQRTQRFWFEHGLLTVGTGDKPTDPKLTSKSLPPRKLFGRKRV